MRNYILLILLFLSTLVRSQVTTIIEIRNETSQFGVNIPNSFQLILCTDTKHLYMLLNSATKINTISGLNPTSSYLLNSSANISSVSNPLLVFNSNLYMYSANGVQSGYILFKDWNTFNNSLYNIIKINDTTITFINNTGIIRDTLIFTSYNHISTSTRIYIKYKNGGGGGSSYITSVVKPLYVAGGVLSEHKVSASDSGYVSNLMYNLWNNKISYADTSNTTHAPASKYFVYNSFQKKITFTTTGSSGSSTFNSGTGAMNVPTYTLSGLGGIGFGSLRGSGNILYNGSGQYSIRDSGYVPTIGTHSIWGTKTFYTPPVIKNLSSVKDTSKHVAVFDVNGNMYKEPASWLLSNSNGWLLNGNTGTNPSTNFIGTTDNKDLVFKVNNYIAGLLDYSYSNAFFGVFAGINNTGIDNTGIGEASLYLNNTGTGNTASGGYCLYHNSIGNYNTAVGVNSLTGNTTGSFNTSIGYNTGTETEAALSYRIYIGAYADSTTKGIYGNENINRLYFNGIKLLQMTDTTTKIATKFNLAGVTNYWARSRSVTSPANANDTVKVKTLKANTVTANNMLNIKGGMTVNDTVIINVLTYNASKSNTIIIDSLNGANPLVTGSTVNLPSSPYNGEYFMIEFVGAPILLSNIYGNGNNISFMGYPQTGQLYNAPPNNMMKLYWCAVCKYWNIFF